MRVIRIVFFIDKSQFIKNNYFPCIYIIFPLIQTFVKMLEKISNNSNYLENYSTYQKTKKLVFLYQKIDVKTAMNFITNLAQFSQISFQKFSHLLNFALCINQDRFFKV